MGPRKSWTDEDSADLASLMAKGELVPSIAMKLGRTPSAVLAKVSELGLRFAPGQRGKRLPRGPRNPSGFSRIF